MLDAFTASMLADMTGGSVAGNPGAEIKRARADSRICRAGDVFIALPGEKLDGSNFIQSAWDRGANVVLAEKRDALPTPPPGRALVSVENPYQALLAVAAARRACLPELVVIGITGSNGKTTTKNILAAIMQAWLGREVLATEGNYNSDIGLPLTLFDLRSWHRYAVLEMGMNRIGEMVLLTELARPDIAIITNIGTAHAGMVGSVKAVAREKRSILSTASKNSTAIIASDEAWKDYLIRGYPGRIQFFGEWGKNGWDEFQNIGTEGFVIKRYGEEIKFPLPGKHNLLNAMAAAEAALALGVPETALKDGLESVKPAPGRCEVIKGDVTVILDSYNANPQSLYAVLDLFRTLNISGRKIIIFGELLELGEETERALKSAGEAIANMNFDAVFLFGSTQPTVEHVLQTRGFSGYLKLFLDMDSLKIALADYVKKGDAVLVKGSRGNALERICEVIVK
ncbi:MAG: hypothetical protein B0D92_05890 [Spirochaeta sp. LUC14_002_19_P3]|nr:MAG: hypothetical protein B0D92_05890 [Spirochaeta sp. LUC14_002_19_P3]